MNLELLFNALVGYLFSVAIGSALIDCFNEKYWKFLEALKDENENKSNNEKPQRWTSCLVGIIERVLYTSSILFARNELIAVWFGVKVVSQWKRWEKDTHKARATFNLFLVGAGLSLAYGVLGGQMALWMNEGKNLYAGTSAVGLILLTYIFIRVAEKKGSEIEKEKQSTSKKKGAGKR